MEHGASAAFDRSVVRAFYTMPDCSLRQALGELVLHLARTVTEAGCGRAQADGFPCPELEPDCATCRQLEAAIRKLLTTH